jgi:2-polyprenyl-3-methyl-5-hydroxy-6-metoxy-1,4-benzoquinol methylase
MKTWNDYAKDYDQKVGETGDLDHRETLNPVITKLLGNVQKKEILDLGCGQGYFSRILAKQEAIVTGVDLSEDLIKIANQRNQEQSLSIKYFISNAADLNAFKNNNFDIIVSNMAFMDIEDIEKTLEECSRILKSNGYIVFSLTNPIFGISERTKDDSGFFLKLIKYRTNSTMTNENRGYYFKTVHYHRPIGYYLNTLANNGFYVTNYEEIATKYFGGEIIKDKDFFDFIQEFPSFLIIKAIKKE